MIKLRTIIILLIIYFIALISTKFNFNILYPYYFLKNIIMYPVKALGENEIILSDEFNNSRIISLEEEINELRKLNNLNIILTDYNRINATVIERNREYWFNTITINKGKSDGILADMAVIDSNGLIGKVINVRNNTSDIKLITTNDINSKISVVIKDKNNIYGITKGYDYKNNLLKGIKAYTTGMGGVFPSGILIGEVEDIVKDNDEIGNIVLIKLASNIKDDKYVSVLQRKDTIN